MSRANRHPLVRLLPRFFTGRLVASLLVVTGLAFALPAIAGQIYQWKDAKGVTHYSDSPPPEQSHKSRAISQKTSTPVAAAAKPVESEQCTTARGNLKQLQGKGPVGMDENKDGKPDRDFTAEERAAQAQYAEAAIKVHCPAAAAIAQK